MTVTPGCSIQSFVLTLSLAISAACVAHAGSISTNDPPVATLADGRTGTIAFEALTPKSSRDLVLRKPTEKSVIAGVLTLPESPRRRRAPGQGSGDGCGSWQQRRAQERVGVGEALKRHGDRHLRHRQFHRPRRQGDGDRPVTTVADRRCGRGARGAPLARHPSSNRPEADRSDRLLTRRIRRHQHGAGADPACGHRWRPALRGACRPLSGMRGPIPLRPSRRVADPHAAGRQGRLHPSLESASPMPTNCARGAPRSELWSIRRQSRIRLRRAAAFPSATDDAPRLSWRD